MLNSLSEETGYSMVEVMVASGLIAVLALGFMQISGKVVEAQNFITKSNEATERAQTIRRRFLGKSFCNKNILSAIQSKGSDLDDLPASPDIIIDENGEEVMRVGKLDERLNLVLKRVIYEPSVAFIPGQRSVGALVKLVFEIIHPTSGKVTSIVKKIPIEISILNGKVLGCLGLESRKEIAVRSFACGALKGVFDYSTKRCSLMSSLFIRQETCRALYMQELDGRCYAP